MLKLTKGNKIFFFFAFLVAGVVVSLGIYKLTPKKYSAEALLVSVPIQIQWADAQRNVSRSVTSQPIPDLTVILSSNLVSLELQNLVDGPVALVVNKRSGDSTTYQLTIISDSIDRSVKAAQNVDNVILKIMETYQGQDNTGITEVISALDYQIASDSNAIQRATRAGKGFNLSALDRITELQTRKQLIKSPVKIRLLGVTPNNSPYSHNLINSILYGMFGGTIGFFAIFTALAWMPVLKHHGDLGTRKT